MNPWKLYDALIDGIPSGVAVKDYCLGVNWSYVEAECGMGISYTARGGASCQDGQDFRGHDLREVAALAKSWCFEEATIGIAAINAWYSRTELVEPHEPVREVKEVLADGTKVRKNDAFDLMRPKIEAKGDAKVVVIGHFPHVGDIAEYAELTVLERNCRDSLDVPDPACEYVIPSADFVFQTGVTLTNKTAPRLLELAKDATVIMVGPSVIMAPCLFDFGVDVIAGSIVKDPERIAFSCKAGTVGIPFGEALERVSIQQKR